ncbi:MAG: putative pyridoxal-dependent aspartate 1-decarboxylase [Deltaproteobacteria bacterium]|nr:putative pyridoxal-dependent aspartate 1-decarboxylase [Deltaproteobacteria bacterium]
MTTSNLSKHPVSRHRSTQLVADRDALMRIFIRPESDAARLTLLKYMEKILFGLHEFLTRHVGVTQEISLKELSEHFTSSTIGKHPEKKLADVITDLIEDIAPHAVNVASPYFVGHMTSALPFFMVHLKTIIAALNQNVIKLETSKVVSVIEKQVLAKIHRLIYQESEAFYQQHVQNPQTSLGCFIEDGTLANITALWVARNSLLAARDHFEGIEKEGLSAAYRAYGIERLVVLVSRLGHYSLKKAGGVLGIGNRNVIAVEVDAHNRMDLNCLRQKIAEYHDSGKKTRVLAVVGIAGTTETGSVDPLCQLAAICAEHRIHFHVDAAWGGPTLMSDKYRHLVAGIEQADSVTIDGHKQFYMPMTCGMVYFKDPKKLDAVEYHAGYVNRPGSVDLGRKSLSGSREASSLILDSTLKIMGTQGYALLIEHGIEVARQFAAEIQGRPLFELITPPELNILTYRLVPPAKRSPGRFRLEQGTAEEALGINDQINAITRKVQQLQREAGKSFVSRTTLRVHQYPGQDIVVFRCVIMNPMTTPGVLREILDEQEEIYRRIINESIEL